MSLAETLYDKLYDDKTIRGLVDDRISALKALEEIVPAIVYELDNDVLLVETHDAYSGIYKVNVKLWLYANSYDELDTLHKTTEGLLTGKWDTTILRSVVADTSEQDSSNP